MNARVTVTVEVTDNHTVQRREVVVASATLTDEVTVGLIGADPVRMADAVRDAAVRAGNTALVGALDGVATAWKHRAEAWENR